MSQYTVTDGEVKIVYQGIKSYMPSHKLIAVVWYGEVQDVWGLDSLESLSELRRFYAETMGDCEVTISTYRRTV